MRYRIHESDQDPASAFIVYDDGATDTVPAAHPFAEQIFEALRSGASEQVVRELINVAPTVAKEFTKITDRVSMRGKKLYFDNDRIQGALSKQIMRSFRSQPVRSLPRLAVPMAERSVLHHHHRRRLHRLQGCAGQGTAAR